MIELMEADDTGSSTAARHDAGPPLTVDVVIQDDRWHVDVPDADMLVRRAAHSVFDDCLTQHPLGVVVVLTSDDRVRELNRVWRGLDKPTNVLSFPAHDLTPGEPLEPVDSQPSDQPIELGDVVLAREMLMSEAAAETKTPADHLAHLVVHGALHLLGYDHENDRDAERMEKLEVALLDGLGVADPYGGT